MEAMQGMFMLPFDNRSFVFSYVLVLGAHTLITKTLLIWTLFFAVTSWSAWEITVAIICGCMACVVTTAGYRMCRKGYAALPILWAAGILAVILLVRQWAAVLLAAVVSMIVAVLYLAFADAYDFYSAGVAKKTIRHIGRAGNVFTYLMRYLMANKTYLINTTGLCGIACFLPLLFGEFQGLNMFPIGLAILCLNTPICTLLSCDPDLEPVSYTHAGTLLIFALQSAIFSVILEWRHPIRGWKTESDLWHHPRKYLVPLIMLLVAAFVDTWTLAIWLCAAVLLIECCVLLFVTRRA